MRKHFRADLRRQYTFVMQAAIVLVLLFLIAAARAGWSPPEPPDLSPPDQSPFEVEKHIPTRHDQPPPPPRPAVPLVVPDDAILDELPILIDSEPDPGAAMPVGPPPRPSTQDENRFAGDPFDVVEFMPVMIGGMAALGNCIEYPEIPRRAGIQGTVTVQFVVDEQGSVTDASVLRSPHPALSDEAVRCIEQLAFEPGRQRDRRVKVRMTVPVRFRLAN